MTNVLIIDYGMGNLRSIAKSLEKFSDNVVISANPRDLEKFDRAVLPGVGSFFSGMTNLRKSGWDDAVKEFCLAKERPLLAICLGMHLLADLGTEDGVANGLGIIKGKVEALPVKDHERSIHIGWNSVSHNNHNLFNEVESGLDFYFVHKYHFIVENSSNAIASTDYAGGFVSAIAQNNVIATQFHPEKSQGNGNKLIKNFLTKC